MRVTVMDSLLPITNPEYIAGKISWNCIILESIKKIRRPERQNKQQGRTVKLTTAY
jgi:hypothetical protein